MIFWQSDVLLFGAGCVALLYASAAIEHFTFLQ